MAADGYIYVSLENRGTPAPKGREWRKSVYRKIGQLNIRDQAMGAKALFAKWPYIDTSRVAVWGWSGGILHIKSFRTVSRNLPDRNRYCTCSQSIIL